MRKLHTFSGSCHCNAVRFEIDTDLHELTTCDCSICSRKNALMVKVHQSAMRIISGTEQLTTYQFHTHTAEHYFCNICGIYPFHRKRVTPDYYGVNVYCLEGFDPADIPVRATVGKGMS
ncbi:GFA family protein [Enterovibrio norvegicus]|uniref:GFA family protein n=1 Tax=Enterovibrio norvegicus TaxID=188144 RepID=UPI000C85931E|nr:GFA family protein [Enterovibrio norvegicus]TKF08218.1 GFA family protein [Enterovibrio norvegicus]